MYIHLYVHAYEFSCVCVSVRMWTCVLCVCARVYMCTCVCVSVYIRMSTVHENIMFSGTEWIVKESNHYSPSCKAMQVIALRCRFVYTISVPVNPRRLDCAISSWSSLARKTTTSSTSTKSATNLRA